MWLEASQLIRIGLCWCDATMNQETLAERWCCFGGSPDSDLPFDRGPEALKRGAKICGTAVPLTTRFHQATLGQR